MLMSGFHYSYETFLGLRTRRGVLACFIAVAKTRRLWVAWVSLKSMVPFLNGSNSFSALGSLLQTAKDMYLYLDLAIAIAKHGLSSYGKTKSRQL